VLPTRPIDLEKLMMNNKPWYHNPAYVLAAFAWPNWFALSWLWLLGKISDWPALAFWLLFFAIALGASAVGSPGKKNGPDSD
jgi:hypothetical protein